MPTISIESLEGADAVCELTDIIFRVVDGRCSHDDRRSRFKHHECDSCQRALVVTKDGRQSPFIYPRVRPRS